MSRNQSVAPLKPHVQCAIKRNRESWIGQKKYRCLGGKGAGREISNLEVALPVGTD